MKLLHKTWLLLVATFLFLSAPVSAFAALIDPVVFDPLIADVGADMTLVGVALIGLSVLALSIKWVKATIFG